MGEYCVAAAADGEPAVALVQPAVAAAKRPYGEYDPLLHQAGLQQTPRQHHARPAEQAELVLTLLIHMDYFMFREGEEKHLLTARRSRPGEQEHAAVVAFAICCCYSMLEAPARSTEEQDLIRELEPCRAWGLSSSSEEDGEGAQLLMGSLPSEEDGGGGPAAAGAGDLLLLGWRGEAGRGCRPQQQKIDREGGVVAGSRSIEMEMWSPDCPPDRSRGSCSWNRSRWTEEEDKRVIRIF